MHEKLHICAPHIFFVIVICLFYQSVHAETTWYGDVYPDPNTWTSWTYAYIGKEADGELEITDGDTLESRYGYIGYKSGSTGKITVSGDGSTWENGSDLYVGDSGTGLLYIHDGGKVNNGVVYIGSSTNSTGEVVVDGVGSLWTIMQGIQIARNGKGSLSITNGGQVNSTFYSYIGRISGSTGEVLVDGEDSTWTHNGSLKVGSQGNGTLNITSGAKVAVSGGMLIGEQSGSIGEVTVDGTASELTLQNTLYVGGGDCFENYLSGSGNLSITNGGIVNCNSTYIGCGDSGAIGEVIVDGAGSTWNINGCDRYGLSFTLSYYGSSVLAISRGGMVNVNGLSLVSHGYDTSSTIQFDNGTFTTNDLFCASVDLRGTGTINTHGLVSDVDIVFNATHGLKQTIMITDNASQNITLNLDANGSSYLGAGYAGVGTMRIYDGNVVETNRGLAGYLHSSTGEVIVDGAGSIWKIQDFLKVGHLGSGTLNIKGVGLVSVAGTLTIDSNGDGDSFINMTGGGMLAIKRKADNSLVDFLGRIAGTDAIRYWNYASDDWVDINEATYGEDYTLSYLVGGWLDGYTVLTVGAPVHEYYLPGDIDGDGMAGDTDLQMLAKFWQTASGATWRMGDFNGDGAVNDIDAAILAVNYGKNISASGSVPEPSEIACLLGLCLAGIIAALHRHPHRLYDEKRR